jgi:hypothetical protein
VGGFHDMSTESCFAVMKTTNINESPGWNGFDWSSSVFYGGESHPGLKILIDVHV